MRSILTTYFTFIDCISIDCCWACLAWKYGQEMWLPRRAAAALKAAFIREETG